MSASVKRKYNCRNAGIAAMDREMLASFLADKEVGVTEDKGKLHFDQNAFAEWLGKPEKSDQQD